jgi:hypothetical protein
MLVVIKKKSLTSTTRIKWFNMYYIMLSMYWLIRQTSLSWDEHGLWCPYIKGWVTNIVGKNIYLKVFSRYNKTKVTTTTKWTNKLWM